MNSSFRNFLIFLIPALIISLLFSYIITWLVALNFWLLVSLLIIIHMVAYSIIKRPISKMIEMMDHNIMKMNAFLGVVDEAELHERMHAEFNLIKMLADHFNLFIAKTAQGFNKLDEINQNQLELEKLITGKTHTLNTILNISQQYFTSEDDASYYQHLLEAAIDVIDPANKGSVLIWDEKEEYFKYTSCVGYDFDVLSQVTYSLEETMFFINSGGDLNKPSVVSGVMDFDREVLDDDRLSLLGSSGGLDLSDTLTSPIYIDGRLYAIFNVDSTQKGVFQESDIQLIQFFTTQISISLKNKLLMDETVKLSKFDKLTGAYNRNYFEKMFVDHNASATQTLAPYALVLCDLNYLKTINDNFGHQAGDKVLMAYSKMIASEIRDSDVFSRVGGDEFILLLKNIGKEQAEQKMAHIFEKYENLSIEFNGYRLPVSFSYGISYFPDDSMVYEVLTKIADIRMYEFKEHYKNTHPGLHESLKKINGR